MDMLLVASLVILIFSVILHEIAHGVVADWLGDPTARYSGRLTLNPIPHIDPVGSIIIPGILALANAPFKIGWAKPVPYNPYNLKNQRWGEAMIGAAGPLTNILLAIFFGILVRVGAVYAFPQTLLLILVTAVYTNLVLALYNLIPIPPLDGSKILRALLPVKARMAFSNLEQSAYALGPFGLVGVGLLAVYLLWPVLSVIAGWAFGLIVGA